MTHLPYIVGAYGIFLVVALALGFGSAARLSRATSRLRALDRRGDA